jgi:hypothetical protein
MKPKIPEKKIEEQLTKQFKVFHFQELDWLIYFPLEGNKGKNCEYMVFLREEKTNHTLNRVNLGALMERTELDEHYPHTVGFFKATDEETVNGELRYMEIRTIHDLNEFWLFLNALDL